MRCLIYAVLCLLITGPMLADDGPTGKLQPRPGKAAKAPHSAKKKAAVKPIQTDDPFGSPKDSTAAADPFGRPKEDPFGGKPATAQGGGSDPFAADPFDGGPRRSGQKPRQGSVAPSGPRFPSITLEEAPQARQRIEAALDKKTECDYLDTPLKDVIDEIAIRHEIPIIINVKALEDFGIGTDSPISINLKGVTLRSALRLMLRELDLTFLIKDELLQITTPEDAESKLRSRLYSVSSLLPSDRKGEYLVKLIISHVAPDTWDEVGGPGAITFVDHLETLTVTQTEDVLRQIDTLLAAMGKLAELQRTR